jgi:hypothetical protein
VVPQPIRGMPAKIWVGLGPLVWEEIDPAQTVVNPNLKFIYRSGMVKESCFFTLFARTRGIIIR